MCTHTTLKNRARSCVHKVEYMHDIKLTTHKLKIYKHLTGIQEVAGLLLIIVVECELFQLVDCYYI